MGNCACGEAKTAPKGRAEVSADQQAKMNEATHTVKQEVTKLKEKEPEKQTKKEKKRITKLEALDAAKAAGALTETDYNAAVRRLQSITGEDPTDPSKKITLPEGLEWMTTILEVLWPSIRKIASDTVQDVVQPAITKAIDGYGFSCEITEFDLGSNSPGFGPMGARKVPGLDGEVDGGVELSLGITYRSNLNVKVTTTAGTVVCQNISFLGTLFVWLRPFVPDVPIVGGIQIAFVNPPVVDLGWSGSLGGAMDFTGISGKVQTSIDSAVASACVIPNFISVPMHKSIDIAKLKSPAPEGVLRVTVQCVANFKPGSKYPWVQIRIGAQTWSNKDSPTNDFLVYNKDQWVIIDLMTPSGSIIGSVKNLPVNRIAKRRIADVPVMHDGMPVIYEDKDGDDLAPCAVQLRAEWVVTNPSTTEGSEKLVSVRVSELTSEADELSASKGPYTVTGTLGGVEKMTKPGNPKPGTVTQPQELLRLIKRLKEKGVEEIAKISGLDEHDLVKEGLGLPELPQTATAWWMAGHHTSNHGVYPDAAHERASWSRASVANKDPMPSKEELDERKQYHESAGRVADWSKKATQTLTKVKACQHPYFESMLHFPTKESTNSITLKVLDKDKDVVATATIEVTDGVAGTGADLEGPFQLSNGLVLHGDVTVKELVVAKELPSNWDLSADAMDVTKTFVEWWKDEIYADDWQANKDDGKKWCAVDWPNGKHDKATEEEKAERVKYYTGEDATTGDLTLDKEKALMMCLKAGALTWGDFDILMGRLRGEEEKAGTIAETLEWVNLLIASMWPSIREYAKTVVRTKVEPQVAEASEKLCSKLKIISVDIKIPKADLGEVPPAFSTIQVEKERLPDAPNSWGGLYDGMVITLHNLAFASKIDVEIEVVVAGKTIKVGIEDFLFRGTIKFGLKPLLPVLPVVGAVEVWMPNPPDLRIDFTGLADVVDKIPGMNQIVCGTVVSQVANLCCVPHSVVVPLCHDTALVDKRDLAFPEPIGVLKLGLLKAANLMAGDVSVTGTESSDAYASARLGDQSFQTGYVTSLDPAWEADNMASFIVYDMDQLVDIEIFDSDWVVRGGDDSLGAVHSKETVLGGGSDYVRRGVPIKALLRLAQDTGEATLGLSTRSGSKAIAEMTPIKNAAGAESTVTVAPTWCPRPAPGVSVREAQKYSTYLMEVQVDALTGLPSDKDFGAPYRIKFSHAGHSVMTKPGHGGEAVDATQTLKAAQRMRKGGSGEVEVAEALQLTLELVKEMDGINGDEALKKEWLTKAAAAVQKNIQTVTPKYQERLHTVMNICEGEGDGVAAVQSGSWVCPIEIAILPAKDDTPLSTFTVNHDVSASRSKGHTPTQGPFAIPVDVPATGGGMFSYIGFGSEPTPEYTGTWSLQCSVLVQGLSAS